MKKVILLFLTLLPLTSHALFYAGGYGQIGFSDLSDNPEAYNSTRDLNHGGWTLHAGIGGRLGISYMLVRPASSAIIPNNNGKANEKMPMFKVVLMVLKIMTTFLKEQCMEHL